MLALIIVISVFILIALLRLGVIAVYNDEGFRSWFKIGFLKFELLKDTEKKTKKKKAKKDLTGIKPGSINEFMIILKSVSNAMSRLKRRLLIKKLIVFITYAGDDPAKTAILYGASYALFNTIIPVLDRNFRIKKHDFKAAADFESGEQKIYAKAAISISVWEIIYVLAALFPIIKSIFKKRPDKRKVGHDNGKSPDQ